MGATRLVATLAGLALATAGCAPHRTAPVIRAAAPAALPPVCADVGFPVYFDPNAVLLNPAARSAVQEAGERLRGCAVARVEVLGLADATGSAAANLAVSRRRAAAVAEALARAGLPRSLFDIGAAGASGATTADGLAEPLRRRVEVVIRASAPPPR